MARARSPSSIEAERLYQDGMKLVDIAKKIGVPDSTVRRWKSTQKWDGNKRLLNSCVLSALGGSFLGEVFEQKW